MISSVVYEKVAYRQIDDMKYAISFDNRKVRETKYRRYEPYRSYFDVGPRGSKDREQLVSIGLATKGDEHWCHVPDDGRLFLKCVTDVEISPESD